MDFEAGLFCQGKIIPHLQCLEETPRNDILYTFRIGLSVGY